MASDYLKLRYLVCILWCQIQTVPITAHDCPNNFSYLFGAKCYSLHADLELPYKDAVDFCIKYNGVLWSKNNEEEVHYLRKVNKLPSIFSYWIGAHKEESNWKYLSDNSLVPEKLIKLQKLSKGKDCLTIQPSIHQPEQIEHIFQLISCVYDIYTICEYRGETCENKKKQGKDCYDITDTKRNFNSAKETCNQLHGTLLELRNESQLSMLKEVKRRIMQLSAEEVKNLDGLPLNTLWQFTPESKREDICKIYENSAIKNTSCISGIHNFACQFDAIPSVNVTSKQSNSRDTSTTLEQSSSILQTEHGRIAVTTKQSENTILSTTSEETPSIQGNTQAESMSEETTTATWTGDISPTTNMFIIIPTTLATAAIIIGIIVLIILQFKILGKTKKGKGKDENAYLEPITTASQPKSTVRRNLPVAPTGTDITDLDYTEVNDNELYEPLRIPNPSLHQYTYID